MFSVLEFDERDRAGAEEGRRKETREREKKRKQSAVSHTGGEVEPLARILLAMSAIWNVESLPLSTLRCNGVVLCLSLLPPSALTAL